MRRALVLGSGGFRGAFSAGVVRELITHLGPEYFDSIYASSIGSCTAVFIPSDQIELCEFIWREKVSDYQLVNLDNPLKGRYILDLEYLRTLVDELDVGKIFESTTQLYFTLTDKKKLVPVHYRPHPDDLLDAVAASGAIPFLHPPVYIQGTPYIDGGLSDQLPVQKAVQDGHEEIIVVLNKPYGYQEQKWFHAVKDLLSRLPEQSIAPLLQSYETQGEQIDEYISAQPNCLVIRPQDDLPLKHFLDTDYKRINDSFDIGVEAAQRFLKLAKQH